MLILPTIIISIFLIFVASIDIIFIEGEMKLKSLFIFISGISLLIIALILSLIF